MFKLLKNAITHLTDQKGDDDEWTVRPLRDNLHKHITNRKKADRKCSSKDDSTHPVEHVLDISGQVWEALTTKEALFFGQKPRKYLKMLGLN